jgi:hypothetical protein
MALLDAAPRETPIGMAVASGAILTALIEALIAQNILSKMQVLNIIVAAQREVGRIQNSPAHDDAKVILKGLTKRFPVV